MCFFNKKRCSVVTKKVAVTKKSYKIKSLCCYLIHEYTVWVPKFGNSNLSSIWNLKKFKPKIPFPETGLWSLLRLRRKGPGIPEILACKLASGASGGQTEKLGCSTWRL